MRKKLIKILFLVLLATTVLSSCRTHHGCPGMRAHNADVKRGLAH